MSTTGNNCRNFTDRFTAISGTIESRIDEVNDIAVEALDSLRAAIAELSGDDISQQAKTNFSALSFGNPDGDGEGDEGYDWIATGFEYVPPDALEAFTTTQVPVTAPADYVPAVKASEITSLIAAARAYRPPVFNDSPPTYDKPTEPTVIRLIDVLPAKPPGYEPPTDPGILPPVFDVTFTPITVPPPTMGPPPTFTESPPTYVPPDYTPDAIIPFTEGLPPFEEPPAPSGSPPAFDETPPLVTLPTAPGLLAEFADPPPVLDTTTGVPTEAQPVFLGTPPTYMPPSLPTEAVPVLAHTSPPTVELPALPDEPTDLDVGLPPDVYQVVMPDFLAPELAAILSYLAEVQSRRPTDEDITARQAALVEAAEQLPDQINTIAVDKIAALNSYVSGLGTWASGYKTQLSAFLDAAQDRIGLPVAVEEAMRSRAFAVEDRLAFQAEQQAQTEWLARGFTLPGGALAAQVSAVRQQNRDKKLALQREIYIETAKLKLETLWKSIEVGANLEFRYHDTWLKAQQLAVETALAQLKAYESTLTAAIQAFSAKIEGWRTELSIASELIKIEIAKTDYNKGLVDIEKARVDASQAEVQAYKILVDSAKSRVDVYDAKVRAYVGQVNGLMQVYEGYKAEVQAYAAGVQGYSARWQAYESQVKGALADQEGFKGEVMAFQAETQAYQAAWQGFSARLQAEGARAGIYQSQAQAYAAQAQGNEAAWRGYAAAVQGEVAKQESFRSQVQAFAGEVQAWAAQWDGYKALITGRTAKYEGYRAKAQSHASQAQAVAAQWQGYESQVKGALAPLEGYKTKVQAFAAKAQGYSAQTEGYRAQVQGEIAKSEAQKADAMVAAAKAQGYSARMQAYEAQIRASLGPLEVYKAQAGAAQGQMQAYAAEWQGYEQSVQGEIGEQEGYKAKVQAFAARVNAYASEMEAVKAEAQSLEGIEKLNATSYGAQMEGYKAQLQAVIAAISKEADVFVADSRRYIADVEGQKINAELEIQNNRVTLQKYDANLQKALEEAKLNALIADNTVKNLIAAQDAIARVSAQLVAGAMSAINVGASLGFNGGETSSTSCDENYNYNL